MCSADGHFQRRPVYKSGMTKCTAGCGSHTEVCARCRCALEVLSLHADSRFSGKIYTIHCEHVTFFSLFVSDFFKFSLTKITLSVSLCHHFTNTNNTKDDCECESVYGIPIILWQCCKKISLKISYSLWK